MIYFVVAQQEVDGEWKLFGPWDNIERADSKIVELDDDPVYSQVELARVLTDEDNPDIEEWSNADQHEKPQKVNVIVYPRHWPKRYNAHYMPCDILEGPCVCGVWHNKDEDWAKSMIIAHGLDE